MGSISLWDLHRAPEPGRSPNNNHLRRKISGGIIIYTGKMSGEQAFTQENEWGNEWNSDHLPKAFRWGNDW